MSEETRAFLRNSFPVANAAGKEEAARKAKEAGMRFLCERAEEALEAHATVIETSDRLRRSLTAAGTRGATGRRSADGSAAGAGAAPNRR